MAECSEYNEISENVTNVFRAYFTAEKMSKAYQNLYDKVL